MAAVVEATTSGREQFDCTTHYFAAADLPLASQHELSTTL